MREGHNNRRSLRSLLPWCWLAVTVFLLGAVLVTAIPAWLVAVWVATTLITIVREGRRRENEDAC